MFQNKSIRYSFARARQAVAVAIAQGEAAGLALLHTS